MAQGTQQVKVTFTVEDVDAFPSAEECARDLPQMLDAGRFHVSGVVIRDAQNVRVDDEWAEVSR